MLDLKIKGRITSFRRKLFFKRPGFADAFGFVEYSQPYCSGPVFGFIRQRCFTKTIDLSDSPDDILSGFKKNTKYEVRRAGREGVSFDTEGDLDKFIDFYNEFAESKDIPDILPQLDRELIHSMREVLVITMARKRGEALVMHSYLLDRQAKRARLLNTASLFRFRDNRMRTLTGMANRFLHYEDMLFFKKMGIEIYDMGGYAYDTADEGLKKINEFKDCFGGELVEEFNYISIPLYLYRYLRGLQKKAFAG